MKKTFSILLIAAFAFTSCKKYLQEKPTGFLTPTDFYKTPTQIQAAVNGAYLGLSNDFTTYIGVSVSPIFDLEYITGYVARPRPSGQEDLQYISLTKLDNSNASLGTFWNATYLPIENCNSIIANLPKSTAITDEQKNKYLGEVRFLRAWYYFQAVRLFGDIPLKILPTTDLSDLKVSRNSQAAVYDQIVTDLTTAETSGLPFSDATGHVSLSAVKSLLAKVYITMAGYPLHKGTEYYQKAYDKANEVIDNGSLSLFANYADLRNATKDNTGEQIFMLQREGQTAPSIMHFALLPYPTVPISRAPDNGGAMAPDIAFYNSFNSADQRKAEQAFFYTKKASYSNPSQIITLPSPYIYKYWDDDAELTGRNGMNIPFIRYADVLLLSAEAKATLDGGTTTDAKAIDAYYQVHHRAFPAYTKPSSLLLDDVLKERYWELCFEFQTWYDMIRTRKAFDVVNNKIVDLIGYKAPQHTKAFAEEDLIFPLPLAEVLNNPNLAGPVK